MKLWNITKGVVVEDFGKVSMELMLPFEFLIFLYVHAALTLKLSVSMFADII